MNDAHAHGYRPRENERLSDQAETLVALLHADTAYPPAPAGHGRAGAAPDDRG